MKKHSFFGLKRQAVDGFLQNIMKRFEAEEIDRQNKLHQLQREIEKLELTVKQLEVKTSHTKEEHVISYAQKRTPLIISWIEKEVEEELKKLNLEYEQDAAALNHQIQKLDKEIENGTSLLFSMINQYAIMIENIHDVTINNDQVNLYNTFASYQIETPFVGEEKAIGYSSFWEGAERYLSFSHPRNVEVTEPNLPLQAAELDKNVHFKLHQEPVLEMDSNTKQEQKTNIVDSEHMLVKLNEIKVDDEFKQEPLESQGVKQELDQIKKRYIVGKLAGLDLYDQKGQLIVGNNEVITNEMIEHAKQEGVLSELIVHMKIPGLGDS